ncbi:MAG: DUF2207 domain-containing protein [Paenibacillaceae bacterium]|nr:DUF2207 domain-containing protein [Paenibacillaceae bacterium]
MASATRIVVLLVVLLLPLFAQPAHAAERSFRIGQADIHARIDSNGDMHVAEEDTYHFAGAFNGIVVDLNRSKSDGIVDFQAFDVTGQQQIPLRSELSGDGDKLQYKVYSESQDESKVFRFTYTVHNVVQVFADTAELYWKFFDEANASELETVTLAVDLPDGVGQDEIEAYGHGPDQGAVEIAANGSVRYQVAPLPAGELLEVRILFPESAVPGSGKRSDEAMLETIRQEEQDAATAADDDGTASVYGALALLVVNLAFGIYAKFGRTFKPDWVSSGDREIPADVTPAVVAYLMEFRVKPRDLMATLVDLVRKQHVEMQQVNRGAARNEDNYVFRLQDKNANGLQPHETMLIDWLFGEVGRNGKVTLAGIRHHARYSADDFRKRWEKWQNEVGQAANRLEYVENQTWLPRLVILAAIAEFFGFWFLAPEAWRWLMFCALPLFAFIPKSKRRTRRGQTEYAKWKAFQRYLRQDSAVATQEPLAVHEQGREFVYAIPLGEAKRMVAATRVKIRGETTERYMFDSLFYTHYEYWTESFEKSVASANQSGRSSGDSGGTFSSGGGDGGGGGGRGAF